jgi:hypothetical protein
MRSRIVEQRFPGHGVIGEEYGTEGGDAEFVWVLDPIDGTKSFITGVPLWGTFDCAPPPWPAGPRLHPPAGPPPADAR